MTRFEKKMTGNEEVRYPEDCAILKKLIYDLQNVAPSVVEELYSEWSEDSYSAGWLILTAQGIAQFESWLKEEV